jgi:hypothetical protein
MMSQNSHWNGQPRHDCTPTWVVLREVEQIEARYRRLLHVRLALVAIDLGGRAGSEVGKELRQRDLALAEHQVARRGVQVRAVRRIGAADDHALAARASRVDQLDAVALLRQHAAGQHHVGPVEHAVVPGVDVAIEQPDLPVGGQHRRDRAQPERRRRVAAVEQLAGLGVVPERCGTEFRVDEESTRHRNLRMRSM